MKPFNPSKLLDALRRGADFNTPLLYGVDAVLPRALPWLPAQVVLRLTSMASVLHHVPTLDGPIARLFGGYDACRASGRLLLLTRRVDASDVSPARGVPPACRPNQLALRPGAG